MQTYQSVQVYGGEDVAVPEYGKVFISIKAKSELI